MHKEENLKLQSEEGFEEKKKAWFDKEDVKTNVALS